eukprot:scaffold106577_cov50-Attheya_sp.AAC.3
MTTKFEYTAPAKFCGIQEKPELKAFAGSLAELPDEQLGEGVEWNDLKSGLLDVDSSEVSTDLITRKNSRCVIASVLETTKKATDHTVVYRRSCLSSSVSLPGIGKTHTMTFLLSQLLKYCSKG